MTENIIPLTECKDGWLYHIAARNADCGIFISDLKAFVIRREKFERIFLFPEYHWDMGEPHGTAKCLAELERAPFLPWKDGVNQVNHPQAAEMLAYLENAEKPDGFDIAYKRTLRYCLQFDRDARAKGRTFSEETIKGWCGSDKSMFERILQALEQDRSRSTSSSK